MHSLRILSTLLFALVSATRGAEIPAEPLVKKGEAIVTDDFTRTDLGAWRQNCATFTVVDGVLKGVQTRSDHGAVAAVHAPLKDGVAEFRFQLAGAASINAVFDDKAFTGSHAGHICRVTFTPKLVRLGDDKEGSMRNDLVAMRQDPQKKAEVAALVAGKTATFPISLDPQRWYRACIEIAGDRMRLSIDDKPVGYLQSPGLAHPTKSDFHFTVSGKDAYFDDVRIYRAAE